MKVLFALLLLNVFAAGPENQRRGQSCEALLQSVALSKDRAREITALARSYPVKSGPVPNSLFGELADRLPYSDGETAQFLLGFPGFKPAFDLLRLGFWTSLRNGFMHTAWKSRAVNTISGQLFNLPDGVHFDIVLVSRQSPQELFANFALGPLTEGSAAEMQVWLDPLTDKSAILPVEGTPHHKLMVWDYPLKDGGKENLIRFIHALQDERFKSQQ